MDLLLSGKSLLDYTNLFSSNHYEKNDKIMLKYFRQIIKKEESIKILNILSLIKNILLLMQALTLDKKMDETRNYFLKEIKQ